MSPPGGAGVCPGVWGGLTKLWVLGEANSSGRVYRRAAHLGGSRYCRSESLVVNTRGGHC